MLTDGFRSCKDSNDVVSLLIQASGVAYLCAEGAYDRALELLIRISDALEGVDGHLRLIVLRG